MSQQLGRCTLRNVCLTSSPLFGIPFGHLRILCNTPSDLCRRQPIGLQICSNFGSLQLQRLHPPRPTWSAPPDHGVAPQQQITSLELCRDFEFIRFCHPQNPSEANPAPLYVASHCCAALALVGFGLVSHLLTPRCTIHIVRSGLGSACGRNPSLTG